MEKEKAKYDAIHSVPGYSPGPGIAHVRTARNYIKPGETIIDFGCGTGDAAQAFIDLGHDIQAVDISRVGLRHDIPFFQASLTDLPTDLKPADWGFCCDVMEHLPTEWVDDALTQISGKVRDCFFSISGQPDSWGKKIGQTLHLTVRPYVWWLDKLHVHWPDVRRLNDSDSTFDVVCFRGGK